MKRFYEEKQMPTHTSGSVHYKYPDSFDFELAVEGSSRDFFHWLLDSPLHFFSVLCRDIRSYFLPFIQRALVSTYLAYPVWSSPLDDSWRHFYFGTPDNSQFTAFLRYGYPCLYLHSMDKHRFSIGQLPHGIPVDPALSFEDYCFFPCDLFLLQRCYQLVCEAVLECEFEKTTVSRKRAPLCYELANYVDLFHFPVFMLDAYHPHYSVLGRPGAASHPYYLLRPGSTELSICSLIGLISFVVRRLHNTWAEIAVKE